MQTIANHQRAHKRRLYGRKRPRACAMEGYISTILGAPQRPASTPRGCRSPSLPRSWDGDEEHVAKMIRRYVGPIGGNEGDHCTMSSATLQINVVPKRMLTRTEAARYAGLSEAL